MGTWVNIFTIRRPGHNGDDDVFLIFLTFGNRINRDGDIAEDDDVIVTQALLNRGKLVTEGNSSLTRFYHCVLLSVSWLLDKYIVSPWF